MNMKNDKTTIELYILLNKMQSIKAQRMKKLIKIKGDIGNQRKEYHFQFPNNVNELIQINENDIDPRHMVERDFMKKILADDFNSWDAYSIYDVLDDHY